MSRWTDEELRAAIIVDGEYGDHPEDVQIALESFRAIEKLLPTWRTQTGIYIRAQEKDGGPFKSYDIADPELDTAALVGWLMSHDIPQFGIRLVGLLLGKGELVDFTI